MSNPQNSDAQGATSGDARIANWNNRNKQSTEPRELFPVIQYAQRTGFFHPAASRQVDLRPQIVPANSEEPLTLIEEHKECSSKCSPSCIPGASPGSGADPKVMDSSATDSASQSEGDDSEISSITSPTMVTTDPSQTLLSEPKEDPASVAKVAQLIPPNTLPTTVGILPGVNGQPVEDSGSSIDPDPSTLTSSFPDADKQQTKQSSSSASTATSGKNVTSTPPTKK